MMLRTARINRYSKLVVIITFAFIVVLSVFTVIDVNRHTFAQLPKYKKSQKSVDRGLNCKAAFVDDPHFAEEFRKNAYKNRIRFKDAKNLTTDCKSIHARGYFPTQPLTQTEANFPIAFARIVYTDYTLVEMMFRSDFAPQNSFCFIVDQKASNAFKKQMQDLQRCFPDNVVLPKLNLNISSAGQNMGQAYLTCMEALQHRRWRYILLLQNHDIKIRTNAELVDIYKAFNGTNDVAATQPNIKYSSKEPFNVGSLLLFKDSDVLTEEQLNMTLTIVKSPVQVSLSRDAVDYLVHVLDLSTFFRRIGSKSYGTDENIFGTLNTNEVVGLPGGFTTDCLKQKTPVWHKSRLAVWYPSSKCLHRTFRHSVCVFGMEDLSWIQHEDAIIVNKFMPKYDFGAAECLLEWVHNRTYLEPYVPKSWDSYANCTQVRFNRWKNEDAEGKFICK